MSREQQLLEREEERMVRDRERAQNRDSRSKERRMDMDKLRNAFEQELQKDGFLKNGDKKYEFELSDKALKINGKSQSKAMHEKYIKLYQEKSGARANGNFNIQFNED